MELDEERPDQVTGEGPGVDREIQEGSGAAAPLSRGRVARTRQAALWGYGISDRGRAARVTSMST